MDAAARIDGLANCITGLSDDELDTRTATRRTFAGQRDVWRLEAEYEQNWMAAREIDQLPWDMFREGFTIEGLPAEADLPSIMASVEGDVSVRAGGRIDRQEGYLHYGFRLRRDGDKLGGAVLLALIDDGLDPIEPLDARRIQRISGWEVLDRSEITPWVGRSSGANVEPEYFVISDLVAVSRNRSRTATESAGIGRDLLQPGEVIHRSRLWVHKGVELSRRAERSRQWWGASKLERNERERRGAEEGNEYARTYMDRASWLHMGLADLDGLLKAKDEAGNEIGPEVLAAKMRTFRKITRTLGIGLTDAGKPGHEDRAGNKRGGRNSDTLESLSESAGDLPELVRLNWEGWQMGAAIPKSIAFGDQPGGLRGGDNVGDWQAWQGVVRAQQKDWGTPLMKWMLTLLFASREGPTGGIVPDGWTIKWRPLLVPSPKEQAEIDRARAEADKIRIETTVAKPDEVREQRLVRGDVDGPLRVEAEVETALEAEVETGVPPAQVGIATASLEGGKAVAAGEVPPEFYEWWLTSIDEQRYPRERASVGAEAAAARSAPPAALPGGTENDLQTEDAVEAEQEPDEVEIAFSSDPIPSDLMAPQDLAAQLTEEFGMRITTNRITGLRKKEKIRTWNLLGKPGHSLREVKRIIAVDNGLIVEPEKEVEE